MPVVRDDADEIELASDQRPQDRGEQDVAQVSRLGLVPTPQQLALRHHLCDEERKEHRDPEPRQLELKMAEVDGDGKWIDDRWIAAHGPSRRHLKLT